MNRSRAALVAAAVSVPLLAACGTDAVSPHTTACRHYELHAGTNEIVTAKVVAFLSGETDATALKATATAIGVAATDAGLTKNLPDKDFDRYRALSEASQTFVDRLDAVDAGAVEDQPAAAEVATPLQAAVKAVEDSCR